MSSVIYNSETGEFFRNGRRADYVHRQLIHKKCGDKYRHGMAVRFEGKRRAAHRLAWFLHYGYWPDCDIDHKDGNPSNNRISNLRLCDAQTNTFNIPVHRDHVHGKEKNVTFDKGRWKACWQVMFKVGKTHIHANCSHKISAIVAARLIRRVQHGEFAFENRQHA